MRKFLEKLTDSKKCGLFLSKSYGLSLLSYVYEAKRLMIENSILLTYEELQGKKPLMSAFRSFIEELEANESIYYEIGKIKKSRKVMRLKSDVEEIYRKALEDLKKDIKRVESY